MAHHRRDILRLHQKLWTIGAPLALEEIRGARCGGSPRKNAHHANPGWIHFFAQRVGECAEGVLSKCELTGTGRGQFETGGRIDEYHLALRVLKLRKQRLYKRIWRADVRSKLLIEIGHR